MSENNHYALYGEPSVQNIEANWRGRLTPEQQSALEMTAKSQRSTVVLFGVMILTFVIFFVFFFWQVAGVDGLLSSTSLVTFGFVVLGVIFLIQATFGGDFFKNIPRDEIENGQVESVIGKIVWKGGRYQLVSDAHKLRTHRLGRPLPPPGDYRFYCLPRSGLVVTVEKLDLVPANQSRDLLLDTLAQVNHFSMEDLQTNREGSLSSGQEVRLLGYASILVVFLLAFIWISVMASQSPTTADNLMINTFLAVIALIMLLRFGWGSVKVIWDIWDGEVAYMDGQVTRHIRRGRNTRYYLYQLDDTKFRVSKTAYNALIEGKNYRVYFGPRSKRLVAIEPM